jgi:Sulfolobus plasmid regulatory protein.
MNAGLSIESGAIFSGRKYREYCLKNRDEVLH